MLLVHALFREAYGGTEEPGMAVMSVHHKAWIAKEGGFTWFSRACSCDREAATLIEADVAADLVARALATGLGRLSGNPAQPGLRLLRRRLVPPALRDREHCDSDSTCRHDRGRRRCHQTCELVFD